MSVRVKAGAACLAAAVAETFVVGWGAAATTAWATGSKSYDGAISVDIDGTPLPSLLELAKANGYRTGDVSTAEIQDATPAVQLAHVGDRGCFGPESAACGADALAAGGLGSISEQLLDTRADVVLGGGLASDADGLTALHHAARQGHLDVVRALVAHGASTTVRDPQYGGTALGHARHFNARWPRSHGAEIVALLERR